MQPHDIRPAVRVHPDGRHRPPSKRLGVPSSAIAPAPARSPPPPRRRPNWPRCCCRANASPLGREVHPVVILLPLFYLAAVPLLFVGLLAYARVHPHACGSPEGLWPRVGTGVGLVLAAASFGLLVKRLFRISFVAHRGDEPPHLRDFRGVIVHRITPAGQHRACRPRRSRKACSAGCSVTVRSICRSRTARPIPLSRHARRTATLSRVPSRSKRRRRRRLAARRPPDHHPLKAAAVSERKR